MDNVQLSVFVGEGGWVARSVRQATTKLFVSDPSYRPPCPPLHLHPSHICRTQLTNLAIVGCGSSIWRTAPIQVSFGTVLSGLQLTEPLTVEEVKAHLVYTGSEAPQCTILLVVVSNNQRYALICGCLNSAITHFFIASFPGLQSQLMRWKAQ